MNIPHVRRPGSAPSRKRGPAARLSAAFLAGAAAAALVAMPSTPSSALSQNDPTASRPWPVREAGVERYFEQVRDNPARLRDFLRSMPKGGDLHTHLSGAVPTESLIAFAADDGLCIDRTTFKAVAAPCPSGARPAQEAISDHDFRQKVIRAWSMEDFKDTSGESGHDHFFAAFSKFKAVTGAHRGRLLAEVTKVAAANHQSYVEPLFTPQSPALVGLADSVEWNPDLPRMRAFLLADARMKRIIQAAKEETDSELAEHRAALGCGTANAQPACEVKVRFDFQVGRTYDPKYVFTELLAGFELAEHDPRYVGVNLVQAEDHPLGLRDYRLHMRMIRYLRSVYHAAHVTLHAGELTERLVPRQDLRFHIRDAVETAQAERIGHGVDVMYEDRPQQLLRTMARRHVVVEAPLTSNCQILEVCGPEHPLRRYLAVRVPVALSTDDQGVSRVDITHEYQRATRVHGLTYRQLRDSARTSLEHAFIQGRSLWRSPGDHRPTWACATSDPRTGHLTPICRSLLLASPKAALQWQYETDLAAFEAHYTARAE
ncbi:adenosine deaminase family protein [Streptomyces halobius]|uniref:adenosine deaminase n=1 Tax=Streptomyces halobius TaxID=2879846 RepID=A0ABY4LZ80_9ACTN|nr:adenosine deaminase [Streptomyces halobius]UQA90773.1 adenosine deaminase [Streptomyces halobius]